MRILVTGGAGFIGGHLCERLLERGHTVTVLDSIHAQYDPRLKQRTIEACREAAQDADGAYQFVEGDVRDATLVTSLVSEADVVYHLAARSGVRQSVETPRVYNEVNVDGTLNVLEAARTTGIRRAVLASSSSVYGKPRSLPTDESQPTTPVSPYGVSKLAAERYGSAYAAVYDLPVVSLRCFTAYGPRMRPDMAISNFVSRCLNGASPVIYGDGTQTRDFTYVTDILDAALSLLDTDAADGEALNIGSGDTIEIRALATLVRDEIDPSLTFEFADRHAADATHTHAETSKAATLLDYEPTYSIAQGVTAFIEWYRANREWYEPLVLSSSALYD